jgi:3-oxoacyl-[acyl-carrier protein] reductase
MNDLTGKVALVTGASKGIGAGIARGLAAAGASVAVNYAADAAGAQATVGAITAAGGTAIAVQGDVSRSDDVKRIFKDVQTAFGGFDILVNNAGIYSFEPLENVTEAEFHREFNTNVLAPILMTQEALKYFPASGGSVINLSSVVSENPAPQAAVYAATKGAIDTLTGVLAKELGSRKIRVNTVAPGVTNTEGLRTSGIPGTPFETAMVGMTPLGRIGEPDDIAPVVVFLASDAAAWVTGERISASGGLH